MGFIDQAERSERFPLLVDYLAFVREEPRARLVLDGFEESFLAAVSTWTSYQKSLHPTLRSLGKRLQRSKVSFSLDAHFPLAHAINISKISKTWGPPHISRFFESDDSAEWRALLALNARVGDLALGKRLKDQISKLHAEYDLKWSQLSLRNNISGGAAYLELMRFYYAALGFPPESDTPNQLFEVFRYLEVKELKRNKNNPAALEKVDRAFALLKLLHHRLLVELALHESWRSVLLQYQRRTLFDKNCFKGFSSETDYAEHLALYLIDQGHFALTELAIGNGRLDVVGFNPSDGFFLVEAKLVCITRHIWAVAAFQTWAVAARDLGTSCPCLTTPWFDSTLHPSVSSNAPLGRASNRRWA